MPGSREGGKRRRGFWPRRRRSGGGGSSHSERSERSHDNVSRSLSPNVFRSRFGGKKKAQSNEADSQNDQMSSLGAEQPPPPVATDEAIPDSVGGDEGDLVSELGGSVMYVHSSNRKGNKLRRLGRTLTQRVKKQLGNLRIRGSSNDEHSIGSSVVPNVLPGLSTDDENDADDDENNYGPNKYLNKEGAPWPAFDGGESGVDESRIGGESGMVADVSAMGAQSKDGSDHTDDITVPESNRRRGVSFDSTSMINFAKPTPDYSHYYGSNDAMAYGNTGFDAQQNLGYEPQEIMGFDTQQPVLPSGGRRARYSIYHGNGTVKKKFRVRPYHCFTDAVHMTEEDIYADSLKPSSKYEFLDSYLDPISPSMRKVPVPPKVEQVWGSPKYDGRIGSLKVEVLGCVALNRQKPDVAVYLVCGDVAFCTDVLHGYRSPMWPSVSRRAAVFPLHHAYAQLFIGVFDVRVRKNKENDVFCGRVQVDVSSIRPDTDYDVTFPLRASTFVYDRHKRGVIRVRFGVHWFSERASLLSYFHMPKSSCESSPVYGRQPTIPCADPKTFRNVAVTVHGLDLPGKYTRNAFRAVLREFSLYQLNIRYMVQVLAVDAIFYENPWISLYLFVSSMYCVITSSVAMIPPLFMGYIILLYLENYRYYVLGDKYNFGYVPLTISELASGLLLHEDRNYPVFEPILLQKRTKRQKASRGGNKIRRMSSDNTSSSEGNAPEVEIEAVDHREFPFADKDKYPKLGVEDALAPSSNNKSGSTTRLHGRLSVYYTATPATESADAAVSADDDESSGESDRDDETVMTESNFMGDSLFDLDDADDDDMPEEGGLQYAYDSNNGSLLQAGHVRRRVQAGADQDNDVKGKKVPPNVYLKKIENLMHKFSLGVSVEFVNTPPLVEDGKEETAPVIKSSKKSKKVHLDEFDRLLGLHSKSANPIQRYASTFLGPLQRMIRVFVYIFRILFHISVWRDPILSFWALLVMIIIWLVLLAFPWRLFFFLISVAALGPQNIFVRKYLEKRLAERSMTDDSETSDDGRSGWKAQKAVDVLLKGGRAGVSMLGLSGLTRFRRSKSDDGYETHRPTFKSNLHGENQNVLGIKQKPLPPRNVAIPYNMFKKDRFFDWPPDPTVSRATPITGVCPPPRPWVFSPSLYRPVQSVPSPPPAPLAPPAPVEYEHSIPEIEDDQPSVELPRGLRKRARRKFPVD